MSRPRRHSGFVVALLVLGLGFGPVTIPTVLLPAPAALAAQDVDVAALYDDALVADDADAVALGRSLRGRLADARAAVLAGTGRPSLLEGHAVLAHSIAVRDAYVDPLNILQADVLARYRRAPTPELLDVLHTTINGVAAGIRNTG